MKPRVANTACLLLMIGVLAGCDRGTPPTANPGDTGPAASAVDPVPGAASSSTPEPVALTDVSEITSDYIIGITYPQVADRYPALAAELKRYADATTSELMRAVEARRQRDGGAEEGGRPPYDLSLAFSEVLDTPRLVAFAADGSMYTGGAHGIPLLERFVWLPEEDHALTPAMLVEDAAGWRAISDYVSEQLYTRVSQQAAADEGITPEERARSVRDRGRMIDDGTAPEPDNFDQFEPVAGESGRITAIRFVFPPYQVGPYSEGAQSVEVPASVLLPHIAPAYRDLFDPTAPPPAAPPVAAPDDQETTP